MKITIVILFVLACILLFFACPLSEAIRGGARGGSRISSRSSRSYRSSYSTYRSTYRSSYRSSRISTPGWKTAFIAGTIYGSLAYQRRRRYMLYPNRAPTICRNSHDYSMNGTRYMEFVCPLHYQKDDYEYCCGSRGYQKCCRYFDDSGRLAGVIVGILIFVAFMVACIFVSRYCNKRKTVVRKTTTVTYSTNDVKAPENMPLYYPQGPTPIQTQFTPARGGYDAGAASGLPYSMPNDGAKYPMPQTDHSMDGGYAPYPSQPMAPQPYPEKPYQGNPVGPLDTGYQPQPMGPPVGYPPQPYPPPGVPTTAGMPYPPANPDGSLPYPAAPPPAYHSSA